MAENGLYGVEFAEQEFHEVGEGGVEGAHGVRFDEDFDVLDYMALYGEEEVGAVLDHLLLELEAVVAHT